LILNIHEGNSLPCVLFILFEGFQWKGSRKESTFSRRLEIEIAPELP
jgi:hypothetical protein